MSDFSGRWGLVLGGGGGKGAFQIGVFKAIKELLSDIDIAGVSGASVGSLNAVLYSQNDLSMSEYIWNNISNEQFLDTELSMIDFKEGLFTRQGLIDIISQYVDFEKIRSLSYPIYASVSRYDENGDGAGQKTYMELNNMDNELITKVLLASSAMPYIYEPVKIGNYVYRDGGLTDNMPIKPLYDLGIDQFICVGLSPETKIDTSLYPGAKIILIKPMKSLGELLDGTLDFSAKGAAIRMRCGYLDGKRTIANYNNGIMTDDLKEVIRIQEETDYKQIMFEYRQQTLSNNVNDNMSKLYDIINKYQ